MGHYSRLKVTQDAPVEVIRAAYRVLAAKYHPDRHVTDEPGGAEAHAEMSALNTAYQVLINPQTRKDYDALLAERKALRKAKVVTKAAATVDAAEPEAPVSTKVDMEWQPPKPAQEEGVWPLSKRMMFLVGSLSGVVLFGVSMWVWQLMLQHQMERALSDQYAARPAQVVPPAEPVVMPSALHMLPADAQVVGAASGASASMVDADLAASMPKRMPSVTDLSKLSNEELAQLLPEMNGVPISRRRVTRHPLDGQPLNLRQDGQLIEVLPGKGSVD